MKKSLLKLHKVLVNTDQPKQIQVYDKNEKMHLCTIEETGNITYNVGAILYPAEQLEVITVTENFDLFYIHIKS